jgi:hypothetical protein
MGRADFIKRIIPTVLVCLLPICVLAQQTEEVLIDLKSEEALNQVQSLLGISLSVPLENTPVNSGVFITQIGESNSNFVRTSAEVSEVELVQIGNGNTMTLDLRARNVLYTAVQSGNQNRLIEFNAGFSGKELIQRDILQSGDYQNLIIHGSNQISDRLRIRMENSGQSLIIRNSN